MRGATVVCDAGFSNSSFNEKEKSVVLKDSAFTPSDED